MRFLAVFLLAIGLPYWAMADSWPVYQTSYVNDYAHLIDADAEERITTALRGLSEETGVEATVLTLNDRRTFRSRGTLEEFATGLFNEWGIGNAETNDGILVLVILNDREMRIELGEGYGRSYDGEAQNIIDTIFLPAFKNGQYSHGIEDGTDAVIERIARVHFNGQGPGVITSTAEGLTGELTPERIGSGLIGAVIGAVVAAGIAALIFGRKLRDRFTRCPNCGTRGVRSSRKVLTHATRSHTGRGEHHTNCPRCGYADTTIYTIPIITSSSSSSSSSGGSFGGGSSSGGGASGSW